MKKESNHLLRASEFAFKNITILFICVFIGVQADGYFKTKPLWIIVSSLIALAYVISMIFLLGSKKNEL
jgi:F0F1-type ATP synthase assembly protein I